MGASDLGAANDRENCETSSYLNAGGPCVPVMPRPPARAGEVMLTRRKWYGNADPGYALGSQETDTNAQSTGHRYGLVC